MTKAELCNVIARSAKGFTAGRGQPLTWQTQYYSFWRIRVCFSDRFNTVEYFWLNGVPVELSCTAALYWRQQVDLMALFRRDNGEFLFNI